MRAGCEAYGRRLDTAWAAVDAGRGIDTRSAYSSRLPDPHHLSVASMEEEGRDRREHLLFVAGRAAEAAAEGGEERPLYQCVAEHNANRAAAVEAAASAASSASPSPSPNEEGGSGGVAAAGGGQRSESDALLDALVVESCVGVLGKVYREGECSKSGHEVHPGMLKRLRFERMLGEYHALMQEEALAAGEGDGVALERRYDSLDTRLAVAAKIPHPMAPAWLELYPPQGWVKQRREEVQDAGLRCDACHTKRSAQELLACSACKAAR